MKKKIVLVFFLICLMLSLPATAKASLGDVLLQVGSRGPDVVELQTKLNYVGFNVGKADGIFGNMTKEGVMNFQRANSLAVDGKVGPMTVKSLKKVYLQKQTQTQTQTQNNVNSILSTAKQYIGVRYQWGGPHLQQVLTARDLFTMYLSKMELRCRGFHVINIQ